MTINIPNILTKTVGAAGLGLAVYDSHSAGKIQAESHQKEVKAGITANSYMDTLTLDSPSVVKSKLKNKYFRMRMDENITEFFTGIAGYLKGFGKMLVDNVVPLALSAGTLVKNKIVSRASVVGLLAYGGIYIGREVMGIGKPNPLGDKY